MTLAVVALTVNVDNDGVAGTDERNALSWMGVERVTQIDAVFRSAGAVATWYVRCDGQLEAMYGGATWLLDSRRDLWNQIVGGGGLLGWHPHMYTRDAAGRFVPDSNVERCAEGLRGVAGELRASSWDLRVVRLGEASHGNLLMQTLDELGFLVDSTALPGRARADASRSFDWSGTPNHPYCPSKEDYRVPGLLERRIVEVPMTTAPFRADYDPGPMLRYVNLAYRPDIFGAGLRNWVEANQGVETVYLTTILHADEVLGTVHRSGLYAPTLETVRENVSTLREVLASHWTVRFGTLLDTADRFTLQRKQEVRT